MDKEWTEDDLRKAVQAVMKKAAGDAKFKQLALKNPAAAIKDVTSREVPSGMKIEMIEAGAEMHGNVQYTPAELSDADLGTVSGGMQCAAVGGQCPCGRGRSMRVNQALGVIY